MRLNPPLGVSEQIAACWRRRATEWPWMTEGHRDALLDYCETWCRWRQVAAQLTSVDGLVERQQSGADDISPLAQLESRYAARLATLRAELGVGGGAWTQ